MLVLDGLFVEMPCSGSRASAEGVCRQDELGKLTTRQSVKNGCSKQSADKMGE
ncbi:hypothetical protein ACN6MY_15875 [Peribacillus sp. B-H-3]|uniref:hypothetical protein n=1 Tax=Peribacillus sp. B-H-3 TaxID=3400420 RepID=UPI003B029D77